MTHNKEAAFRSAVARAFRGNDAKIDEYEAVTYDPTNAEFQHCCAEVMQALEGLPDTEKVDLDTFAFMLGIGPNALGKRKDKPVACDREESAVSSMAGKTRPSYKPVWTIQQVKVYRSGRTKQDEQKKDEQSSVAVSRRDKRRELKRALPSLLQQLQERQKRAKETNAPRDWANVMDTVAEVLVATSGLILGFVDLHNLSREELRDALRAGARIERMTLRQAVIERGWASAAALRPWAYEYQRFVKSVIEGYVVRESDLVAAAVARSENEDLGGLPKGKPGRRNSLRL